MSEIVKKASFKFVGYQVKRFSFQEPVIPNDSFSIDFNPSGTFSKSKSIFQLKFDFRAFTKGDTEQNVVGAIVVADFRFEDNTPFSDIPPYFYKNSIAIVFPYLRSFVSTLTFQANIKPLLLPIMNLSELEEPLRQNTSLID